MKRRLFAAAARPAALLLPGLLALQVAPLRAEDTAGVTNRPAKVELTLSAPAAVPGPVAAPAVAVEAGAELAVPSVAAPGLDGDPAGTAKPRKSQLGTAPGTPAGADTTAPVAEGQTPVTSVRLDTGATPLAPRPQDDAQRRLEAPTPEALIARYGTVGFLLKEPEPRNFVELINPFAPASFGPKPREVYNRNPNLKPGASLPRTFNADGIHQEPELNVFSWPW